MADEDNAVIVFDRAEFNRWWSQPDVGGTDHRVPAPRELHDVKVERQVDPLSVECPLCGSAPGEPCVSLLFSVTPTPQASHVVRTMRATNAVSDAD